MTFARSVTEYRERRAAERAANLAHLATTPSRSLHTATMGGSTTGACPKPQTHRDPALLAMQRGRPCKLLAVEQCETFSGETTVACHENEGKGMGIKASDYRSVGGCRACHEWYDQGKAPRAEKRRVFAAAYERQVEEWRRIAHDEREPMRDRAAAVRAIKMLEGEACTR